MRGLFVSRNSKKIAEFAVFVSYRLKDGGLISKKVAADLKDRGYLSIITRMNITRAKFRNAEKNYRQCERFLL